MSETAFKILLVEDDEDDYVLTRQLLQDAKAHRYVLEWIRDPATAIAALMEGRFDLCLVDYHMGGKNGIDFIREAGGRNSPAPIILLTGEGDPLVDIEAMNAGAADYLNKTHLTADLLDRAIRYTIEARKGEEQRISLMAEQSARAQAEAASLAKDRFLATLSHELRTPLTPVLLAVASMERDPEMPERFQQDMRMVRQNVELESKLIDDLLDLTRIARGKLEVHSECVDVHALLAHIVKSCREGETVKRGQRLSVALDAAEHHVWGDGARLQQIFWNLVRNAIKFTPEAGTITVRTSNTPPATDVGEGEMAAGAEDGRGPENCGGDLIVEVSDTGIGIDAQTLPRIFNAFEQGDRAITRTFGGLGLGLAVSKALVDLHHGAIDAKSAGADQGATFTVRLGAIAAPHHAQPASLHSEAPQRSLSILLVEDHEHTSRMITRLLQGIHYDVTPAANIAHAKELARHGVFDLVISDLGLPDGSGLDLMRHLKAQHGLNGIALSGYGMEEDVKQSKAAGFAEHLVKPVSFEALEAAIARLSASA